MLNIFFVNSLKSKRVSGLAPEGQPRTEETKGVKLMYYIYYKDFKETAVINTPWLNKHLSCRRKRKKGKKK